MQPVILTITPAEPGYMRVVVSTRPGRRVQLVVPAETVTGPEFPATIAALAKLTDRKGIR